VVGRAVVDGRETLYLRETVKVPKVNPAALGLPKGMPVPKLLTRPRTIRADIWVDPLTYLTVRTRSKQTGGSPLSDTTWLPRTAVNLSATGFVVPQGFKHLSSGTVNGTGLVLETSVLETPCRQS
jgi:hypothetical protein